MADTILVDFLSHIKDKIDDQASRVYLEDVPSGASFPYAVYRLASSSDEELKENFILEVNVWDNCPDNNTIALENLTQNIDDELNEHKYNTDNMQISIYRISRSMIPDPDENIHRRELRYECKTYFYST